MKTLVCEMCNSTDLLKQDGVFVCQSCGCKYTVEEARKMMVEGTGDISGITVKVDISEELKNLYQLARRAKDAENNENATKYYDMILLKDPSSWEANFYSVYFKAMSCKIAEISMAATNVTNCIKETFLLIRDNVHDGEERKTAVADVGSHARKIYKILFNAATSHMEGIDPMIRHKYQMEYLTNAIAAGGIMSCLCDSLCEVFIDDETVMSSVGVKILKDRVAEGLSAEGAAPYVKAINKYDPTYEAPKSETAEEIVKSANQSTNQSANASTGGCYVATAVYGSYDCPQVWTLRRFRDDILAETWYGRAFIRTYYAISPTLVKWFGHTEWFKAMWKGKLDRMVAELNADGVEDTPYEDKVW